MKYFLIPYDKLQSLIDEGVMIANKEIKLEDKNIKLAEINAQIKLLTEAKILNNEAPKIPMK